MNLPSLYPPSVITHESSHFPDLASQLRSLRAALTVVRQGSTIRAAQAMHLSQPAVARSVLQLEEACRLPLFIRGARGMMPTALETRWLYVSRQCSSILAAEPPKLEPHPPSGGVLRAFTC
jgi:DNA-binding transcriptional LysR family regulator